jgi:hypothetical protein
MNEIWYVICRKDNNYPLQIYADKELAEGIARANDERIVVVIPKPNVTTQ